MRQTITRNGRKCISNGREHLWPRSSTWTWPSKVRNYRDWANDSHLTLDFDPNNRSLIIISFVFISNAEAIFFSNCISLFNLCHLLDDLWSVLFVVQRLFLCCFDASLCFNCWVACCEANEKCVSFNTNEFTLIQFNNETVEFEFVTAHTSQHVHRKYVKSCRRAIQAPRLIPFEWIHLTWCVALRMGKWNLKANKKTTSTRQQQMYFDLITTDQWLFKRKWNRFWLK